MYKRREKDKSMDWPLSNDIEKAAEICKKGKINQNHIGLIAGVLRGTRLSEIQIIIRLLAEAVMETSDDSIFATQARFVRKLSDRADSLGAPLVRPFTTSNPDSEEKA